MKDRPIGIVCRCPKTPTMRLDDRTTNSKSYPRTGGFCRKERLEDTVSVLTFNSCPKIFNGDQNAGRPLDAIGRYPQPACTIADRAHCFDRVHNQIQKNLLQLAPIGKQRWKSLA